MSVLWHSERDGTRYSVRRHGATVRLYSNDVFHSQWNPDRPFAGGVWDCLSLPALYRPPESLRRILLLGVGGGAVIRQLEHLVPFATLTAIEIDPVHLEVARRWFGVEDERVSLHEADAIDWLRRWCDEPYDLVIDDLFGHADGEPVRAQPLTPDWVSMLRAATRPEGLLVVNCIEAAELEAAAAVALDEGLAHARRWAQPGYDNAIGVFGDAGLVPRDWSRRLDASTLSSGSRRQARRLVRRPLRA